MNFHYILSILILPKRSLFLRSYSYVGARLQATKPDMTHVTSCRKIISIELTASAVLVVFWLVLFSVRFRKNFVGFSFKRYNIIEFTNFQHTE